MVNTVLTRDAAPDNRQGSIPDRLGSFLLEREIGRGGFGVVYEARDLETSSVVALKVLHTSDADRIASFKNEVRRVAHLSHPNILVPLELFNVGSYWCFSMELVQGTDLVSFVRDSDPEGLAERIGRTFGQLLHAIGALHAEGLLHLDLKPANVLVRGDGHVFVLDFGIARTSDRRWSASAEPWLGGTPQYTAPELSAGGDLSARCDCYSIGVMLHQALTGTLPTRGALHDLLESAPELGNLCSRLLAERPDLRPSIEEALRMVRERHTPPLPRHAARIIGREKEAEDLHRLLARCRKEGGQVVLLAGGPGIGKTTLVRSFIDGVDDGFLRVVGACHARESIPYKGIDTIIHELAAHASTLGAAAQRSLLTDGIAEAARIFTSLRRLEGVNDQRCATEDPQVFMRRATAALRTFVRSLARLAPMVVCLDDAHWADADGLSMWLEVFCEPSDAPILALLAARHEDPEADGWRRALRARAPSLHELVLEPLDSVAAQKLARELTDEPSMASRVAEAAGGNPLLIEELARSPTALASSDGVAPLDRLVRTRFEGLSVEARHVLVLAALAGRPVSQTALFDAAESVGSTHRILSELHRAAFVRTRSAPQPRLIELRHDLLGAALLNRIDARVLPSAHASLARSFEAHGEPPADTAEHYARAGRPDAARALYVAAAEQARGAFAFEAAARYYEAALATGVDNVTGRSQLELARAECLFNAGRCAEAAPVFLSSAVIEPEDAAWRRLRAAEAWLVAGRIDEGLAVAGGLPGVTSARASGVRSAASLVLGLARLLVRGTQRRARKASDPEARTFRSDASWTLAKGLMYVMPLQATDSLVEALESALTIPDDFRVARSLGLLGAGMFMQIPGLTSVGRSYLDEAIAIGTTLRDPYLEALGDVWLAFADMYEGRWSSMLARSERGRALLEQRCVGTAWEGVVAKGLSVWALQFMGRMRECGELAAAGLDAAIHRGDLYGEVLFSQYLAYAEMAGGDVEGARRRIRRAASRWTPRSYTVPRFYTTFLEAMCDLLEDRPLVARERLDSDQAEFRRSGGHLAPMSRIDEGLLRARILLRQPNSDGLGTLDEIAARMDRERRSDGRGHAAFIRAARATREGRTEDARRVWSQCADRYAGAEMFVHAAAARLHHGELAGRASAVEAARATMRSYGVHAPDVWARALMPSGAR